MKEKCPSDCLPIVHPHTKDKYDPAKGYTHSGCLQVVKCKIPQFKKVESKEPSATPGAEPGTSNKSKRTPNTHINEDLAQQTKDQRRRYLDEVHRADAEFSKSGAPLDTFKTRPLLWSEFVKDFVFERPHELRKKLSGWRCKHIILSKGKAEEICSALLACDLHDQFHCVLDTTAQLYRPRKGYTRPPGLVSAYGITEAFLEAWVRDDCMKKKYPSGIQKDELIAEEMDRHWNLLLPGLETKSQAATRVVYIDDDPERQYLPDTVTVVQLPREGAGIMSTHGRAALQAARVDLDSLGSTDVVVWDFDCTLTQTHLYKTLHTRRTPAPSAQPKAFEDKWGSALAVWWSAQRREAEFARNDVLGDLQRKMAELQRIKLSQAEAEAKAAQEREADAERKGAEKPKDAAALSRDDNGNVTTAAVPFPNADLNTDTETDTETDTDTDESQSSIDEKKATGVPGRAIEDSANTDAQLRQNQHVAETLHEESEDEVEKSTVNAEAEKWKTEAEKWKTEAEASELKAKAAEAEAETARRWKAEAEAAGKKFAEADAEKRNAVSQAEHYKALATAEKHKAEQRQVEAEAVAARQREAEAEAAKKQKAEIEKLKAEAEKSKAQVETWVSESESWKAESKSWEADAETCKAESESWKAESESWKAEAETWKAESETWKTESESWKTESESWKAEAETWKAESESWKADAETWKAESESWKAEAEVRKAEVEEVAQKRKAEVTLTRAAETVARKCQAEVDKWKGRAEKFQTEIEQLKGKAEKWKVEVEVCKSEVKAEKFKTKIAAETARQTAAKAEKWKTQVVATRNRNAGTFISLLHGICFLGHSLALFGYSFLSRRLPFLDLRTPIVKFSFYSCSFALPIASLGLFWHRLREATSARLDKQTEASSDKQTEASPDAESEAEKLKDEASKSRDDAPCIA